MIEIVSIIYVGILAVIFPRKTILKSNEKNQNNKYLATGKKLTGNNIHCSQCKH